MGESKCSKRDNIMYVKRKQILRERKKERERKKQREREKKERVSDGMW